MDTSFAGFTFGADELGINGSFSAQKHPRISKCSPFYRMNKPQTEQKPRLRLHSPNKENELMQIRKPVRVTTSPHSQHHQMSYKEICAHLIQLFKSQTRLYEQLMIADNVNIRNQLQKVQLKHDYYCKLYNQQ
ncbi:unnamed protein product (macronuclear) [Paramecium tetraurelia]|uniref:Uncharacterized protein n=2 Tax=Paramecium TaxID=5884 RepID=A0CEQ0_PARTE|nr:uncharacterized protein GSPATT00037706001 [Paramecium tetraurelia]CAD8193264.1 unnamed protein product [Paramecium octaurelia]CAK69267.1 unnamed protein product [Paramecium tetraurelia]|eukprot:XP_001436664.1 hypothetical protein (macronuclear) [Paramecium tetraurelia strain d4-2]